MEINWNDQYQQHSVIAIQIQEDEEHNVHIKEDKQSQGVLKNIKKSSFDQDQISGTFTGLGQSFSDFNTSQADAELYDDLNQKKKQTQQSEFEQKRNMYKKGNNQIFPLIKINFRVSTYYLQSDECSIQVNHESLQRLSDQFFKRQLFIPLFTFQRLNEWEADNNSNRNMLQNHSHKHFRIYLERYVQYLNEKYPKQFHQIIKNFMKIPQNASDRKQETRSIFSILSKNVSWVVQNIKSFITTPKSLTLRNALLSKINSMNQAKDYCQFYKCSKYAIETITNSIQLTWKNLAETELLLSFQATEDYCAKRTQENTSIKFKQVWNKYQQKMRIDKAEFQKTHMNELNI